MSTDALNALRSLFAPTLRNLDSKQPDAEKAFLDALGLGKKTDAAAPVIDKQAVEKQPDEDPQISDVPVTPGDDVDPQILLTQKLAASLMGFQDWRISKIPEIPTPEAPAA